MAGGREGGEDSVGLRVRQKCVRRRARSHAVRSGDFPEIREKSREFAKNCPV